jgi:hypothetical protein
VLYLLFRTRHRDTDPVMRSIEVNKQHRTTQFKIHSGFAIFCSLLNEAWFFQLWFQTLIAFKNSAQTFEKLLYASSILLVTLNMSLEMGRYIILIVTLIQYSNDDKLRFQLRPQQVRMIKARIAFNPFFYYDLRLDGIASLSYHILTMIKKAWYLSIVLSN